MTDPEPVWWRLLWASGVAVAALAGGALGAAVLLALAIWWCL